MAQSITDIKQERQKVTERGGQALEWERTLITFDSERWHRKNNLKCITNL